jgi:hypothetical protein
METAVFIGSPCRIRQWSAVGQVWAFMGLKSSTLAKGKRRQAEACPTGTYRDTLLPGQEALFPEIASQP